MVHVRRGRNSANHVVPAQRKRTENRIKLSKPIVAPSALQWAALSVAPQCVSMPGRGLIQNCTAWAAHFVCLIDSAGSILWACACGRVWCDA